MVNITNLAQNLKQNTVRSLKIKLYLFSFFDEFILIYPFYAIMFQDKGLDSAQISSLLITLSVVIFLLQIPSGMAADKYSRKKILVWSILMRGLAFACWIVFPNYIGFFVGFILWGIKRAFVSGTLEALVYDELKRFSAVKQYAKVAGAMQSYALTGFVLGGLAAGALAFTGYTFILVLSIAAVCISALTIAMLPKASIIATTNEYHYFDYLRSGVKIALMRPTLLLIIFFGAAISGLKVVDEYYNLFLDELHFTNATIGFGWQSFPFSVLSAVVLRIVSKIKNFHLVYCYSFGVWC